MSSATNPKCPKCDSSMEEGFILDNTYGARLQSEWVEGEPDVSRWTGLKLKGHEHVPIATLRCTRCGYLELYARP